MIGKGKCQVLKSLNTSVWRVWSKYQRATSALAIISVYGCFNLSIAVLLK